MFVNDGRMTAWLNSEWSNDCIYDWIVNDRMIVWLNSEWSNDCMIE